MKDKQLKVGERMLSYLMVFISILVLYEASKISGFRTSPSSSGAFPLAVSFILWIFSLWVLLEKKMSPSPCFHTFKDKIKAIKKLVFCKDILIMIAFFILYSIFLGLLGFHIATFIFLWISMTYLTSGNSIRNLLIAGVNLSAIWFIFTFIFKVVLP